MFPPLFIDVSTDVSEGRMTPNAIVKRFQVDEERLSGFFIRWIGGAPYTFLFEGAKEALHRGIVPTIAFA